MSERPEIAASGFVQIALVTCVDDGQSAYLGNSTNRRRRDKPSPAAAIQKTGIRSQGSEIRDQMTISFHGISRLKFRAIRARVRAQAEKMSILNDSFSAVCNGIPTEWTFNEAEQSLVVTCNKRPRLHTEGWVASRIQGLVESL